MSTHELAERTLYAALKGAAQLALALGPEHTPRSTAKHLQVAFFHALRDRGLPIKAIAAQLKVSTSTAAKLSRELKQLFTERMDVNALARRIEFALWAKPLSAPRLAQLLKDVEPAQITATLAQLIREDRVHVVEGRTVRYGVQRSSRIVRSQLLARLDGVGQFVTATHQAIFARLFRPQSNSFARVLSLRVRREDEAKLRALYEDHIWPTLVALDAAAEGVPEAEPIEVAFSWAPYELFTTPPPESQL